MLWGLLQEMVLFPLLEFSGEDHTVSHLLLAKQSDTSDLALRVELLGQRPQPGGARLLGPPGDVARRLERPLPRVLPVVAAHPELVPPLSHTDSGTSHRG